MVAAAVSAAALAVAVAGTGLAGCGGGGGGGGRGARPAIDPSYLPLSVGPGPGYRPAAGARPAGAAGRACRAAVGARRGVHVELFAHRRVVVLPAGIGVLAPRRRGPYVVGGRCFYALITREPTGVVEMAPGGRPPLRLGDLFALWGQRLSARRLAGFAGARVRAFVGGRAVAGDPAGIVLRPHAEIVLEISGYVPPHRAYGFPGGL